MVGVIVILALAATPPAREGTEAYIDAVVDNEQVLCTLERGQLNFSYTRGDIRFQCKGQDPTYCMGTVGYDPSVDKTVYIQCTRLETWVQQHETCDPDLVRTRAEADSVAGASITISANPQAQQVAAGGLASFTVQVRNNGTLPLTNVAVSSSPLTNCARTFASLGVSSSVSYPCTRANVQATIANALNVTGSASDGTTASAGITAMIFLQGQELQVCKLPKSQVVGPGGTAIWNVDVTNKTGAAVTGVLVNDSLAPGCERNIGTIPNDGKASYACSRAFPQLGQFAGTTTAQGYTPAMATVGGTMANDVTVSPDVIFINGFN